MEAMTAPQEEIRPSLSWKDALLFIQEQKKRIDELEKDNLRLKQAAEDEFQRAEGKAEMKRWFQEKLVELEKKLATAREEINEQKEILHKACLDGSAFENKFARAMDVLRKIALDPNVNWEGKRNFAKEALREMGEKI